MITAEAYHQAETAAEAWGMAIRALLSVPETACGSMASELHGVTFHIHNPAASMIQCWDRKFNYRSIVSEGLWNLSNRDDTAFLFRFNKNILRFVADQSDKSRVDWAYGPTINHQVRSALEELKRDPTSRRARASIDHKPLKGTPPCLTSVQWFIRDSKLHQVVNMRSNDVWLGMPLDFGQFMLWQQLMAAALELPIGNYIHQVGSLHLYHRDLEAATALRSYLCKALTPPLVTSEGLNEALDGRILDMSDHPEASWDYVDKAFNYDRVFDAPKPFDTLFLPSSACVRPIVGLKAYAALLLGDYPQAGAFAQWKQDGEGIGW